MRKLLTLIMVLVLVTFASLAQAEGVILNLGKSAMATALLTSNTQLALYCASHTPVAGDTLASYTLCSGSGYAAKTLTGGSWTITPGTETTAEYAQQTFSFSGTGLTIYGTLILNSAGTVAYFAEALPVPVTISSISDTIKITPHCSIVNP